MQKERSGWQLNRAKSLKKPHQETAGETRRPRPQAFRSCGSRDQGRPRAYGPRWYALGPPGVSGCPGPDLASWGAAPRRCYAPSERPIVRFMGRHTGEELEIIALIERMQDRRLTAAEAAIALAQAYAIGELSEPPDNMPAWDVVAPRRQAGCAEEAAAGLPPQ